MPKTSALGRRLVAGLNDALAHARGELALPSYTVNVPETVDVAKLRHRLGLADAVRIGPHAYCSLSSPRSRRRCCGLSQTNVGDHALAREVGFCLGNAARQRTRLVQARHQEEAEEAAF
jgi:hypothetical protein